MSVKKRSLKRLSYARGKRLSIEQVGSDTGLYRWLGGSRCEMQLYKNSWPKHHHSYKWRKFNRLERYK